jgi:hypothetical protein
MTAKFFIVQASNDHAETIMILMKPTHLNLKTGGFAVPTLHPEEQFENCATKITFLCRDT